MKSNRLVFGALAVATVLAVGVVVTPGGRVSAHCQIPCGIYGDDTRFTILEEHITTLEKSMNQIIELSKDPSANANQIARWVANKEHHADDYAHIVTYYFLQQRVKPVQARSGEDWESYVEKIRLCHEMLVATMKIKQTTDLEHIQTLRGLLADFHKAYSG
jgi:nickel superoxide dismutase